MGIENLIKYEGAFYAGTKFKESPESSLEIMLDFFRKGSKGADISFDSLFNGIEAEAQSELKRYGTFRGGIASAMQEYAGKYQKELESTKVVDLISYSRMKVSDDENKVLEISKHCKLTYKEIAGLSKDKKYIENLSDKEKFDLLRAVQLAEASREYRFNEIEYNYKKKDLLKTKEELLKNPEDR